MYFGKKLPKLFKLVTSKPLVIILLDKLLFLGFLTPGLRIERSGPGHCVVFLGKTLYTHGASLHPGV